MSRLKKYTRTLLSGYVLLGANIFYTLVSVPLALHYLTKAEFGLWALVSQLSSYIQLLDLGMTTSVARILIDHKDERSNGIYGTIIKTGVLVGLVQCLLIITAGTTLSFAAGTLLHVPENLHQEFFWLMAGQSVLLGVNFLSRIFGCLLTAHQRLDIYNYGIAVFFLISLAVMWAGFSAGLGIYSFLIGQVVPAFGVIAVNVTGCLRLQLLPRAGEWGRLSRARFRELFVFGNDIFIYALGSQLITASQTILLTRLLGLETAAVWSICTRVYNMLPQIIFRFFDYSTPALAEMMVRGEKDLLARRFQQLAVFSVGLAVAAGAVFALCNSAFVTLWTHGRISWPHINDLLLAIWLVICAVMRLHTGLAGQTKKFHFMRFMFFIEGIAFVGLTIAFYRLGGITTMLVNSIICTTCLSLPYGLYRTRHYFGLSWRELADWHRPTLRMIFWLLPAGLLIGWLTRSSSPGLKLVLGSGVFGCWTLYMFLRFGLSSTLQGEMASRVPTWLKSVLVRTVFN